MESLIKEVTKALRIIRHSAADISALETRIAATRNKIHDLSTGPLELRIIDENFNLKKKLKELEGALEQTKQLVKDSRKIVYDALKEFNGRDISLSINEDNNFTDIVNVSYKKPINDYNTPFTLTLNGNVI